MAGLHITHCYDVLVCNDVDHFCTSVPARGLSTTGIRPGTDRCLRYNALATWGVRNDGCNAKRALSKILLLHMFYTPRRACEQVLTGEFFFLSTLSVPFRGSLSPFCCFSAAATLLGLALALPHSVHVDWSLISPCQPHFSLCISPFVVICRSANRLANSLMPVHRAADFSSLAGQHATGRNGGPGSIWISADVW